MAETLQDSAELLRRLAATRDAAAWSELIERHGPEVFRVTRRILSDESAAEDACQETLLQVREHAGKFTPPPGATSADDSARRWIVRIAANTALMLLRKRIRGDRGVNMVQWRNDGNDDVAPDEAAHRNQMLGRIHHELGALPEILRSAVLLRFYANLEYEELAAELRCPVGTAKARVSRGIDRLRERVAAGGLVLAVGAIEKMLNLPAGGGAVDAARLARWKQLLDTNRTAALNAVPLKGMSIMAKVSIAGAGILLTAIVAATQLPGRAADSAAVAPGNSGAATATGTNSAQGQSSGEKQTANPHAATWPKECEGDKRTAEERATLGARLRRIVDGINAPKDIVIEIQGPHGDELGVQFHGKSTSAYTHDESAAIPLDQALAILRALGADLDALPHTLGDPGDSGPSGEWRAKLVIMDLDPAKLRAQQLKDSHSEADLFTNVNLLKNWKNADVFWKAVATVQQTLKGNHSEQPKADQSATPAVKTLTADKDPAEKAAETAGLADSLKQIANGKLSTDALSCSAIFFNGEMQAQFKLGDEGPNFGIHIVKSVVQIQTSYVSGFKQVDIAPIPASIPTFATRAIKVDATDAELRSLAGLLADAGLMRGNPGFSGRGGERSFHIEADINGQSGALKVDLHNEAQSKRLEKLITLLEDLRKRPEK